jgi:16S rRNA processing protein RimM
VTAEPLAGHLAGLALARILRPWGRRGEVAAQVLTDFPERLSSLQSVLLCDGHNPPRSVGLRSSRLHLGQAILHFEGVDSISEAERLRGLEVQVPLGERLTLPPGRYYISDLVGCTVWEYAAPGAQPYLGTVRDVLGSGESGSERAPQSWHLVVDGPVGEVLIPLAAEICTLIDLAARRIDVRLPEGLRELNRDGQESE